MGFDQSVRQQVKLEVSLLHGRRWAVVDEWCGDHGLAGLTELSRNRSVLDIAEFLE